MMDDRIHSAEEALDFRAGSALGLDHLKLGMWLFLASEVMFFGGLISAFLHYKINNPTPESSLLDVGLVGVNTFSCEDFINRGGRIPAPIHSFKN